MRFAFEAFAEVGLCNLDRDQAVETCVARLVHFSHPTRANRRENLVRAEFVAYRKRHMSDAAKSTQLRSG